MIKLYHYSQADFKGYVKPDFFGNNSFTNNSERLSGLARAYFYLDKDKREFYFNGCKFLYIAKINKNRLYSLTDDKLSIVKKFKNTSAIFRAIKRKGYTGLIGNNGYNCVVLFDKVKIISQEVLR